MIINNVVEGLRDGRPTDSLLLADLPTGSYNTLRVFFTSN